MKSKVIIFCVLLFCSKFVESSPYAEELARQRAYPAPNWPGNQNVPGQYHNNEFTRTRNEDTLTNPALQHDNSQDYYGNQGRHLYKSYGPQNNPTALPPMKDTLVNHDSPGDAYPSGHSGPRDSYQSRTSELGLKNQHLGNQNWRFQKQPSNSGPSEVLMSDQDKPVMTPVREPYQGPVQIVPPKYGHSSNQQYYQGNIPYTRRAPSYPLIENSGNTKYVETYGTRPETNVRRSVGQRYVKNPASPSETIYNGGPAVAADDLLDKSGTSFSRGPEAINTDLLTEKSQNVYNAGPPTIGSETVNNRYVNKYKSHPGPSYIDPLSNYNHRPSIITDPDNYETGSRANKYAPVYNKNDVPADSSQITFNHYRSGSGWGNTAPETSYSDAPIVSKKGNENYESGFEQNPNINNGAPTIIKSEYEYYQSGFDSNQNSNEDSPAVIKPNKDYYQSGFETNSYNNAPTVIKTENDNYQSGFEPIKKYDNNAPAVIKSGNENYQSGFEPNQNSNDDAPAVIKTDKDYYQSGFETNSYNNAPTVIKTENDNYQSGFEPNKKYYKNTPAVIKSENEKYQSGFEPDQNSYNNVPTVIKSENEHYQSGFEPNKNYYNDAPTVITSENENYRSGYEATRHSYNDGPAVIKSGNENYESVENYPAPINSYKSPLKPTSDSPLTYPGNIKHEDNSMPHNGQNNPAHRIQNVFQQLPSGIHNYDLKNITSDPYIKKILTSSKKRYVKIHKNGTVEYLDRIEDISNDKKSNFRHVHVNRDKLYDTKDDTGGDEDNTTKSPATSSSSSPIPTTLLPVDKHILSPNENQPLDKDYLPINKNPPVTHKHPLHKHSHKHSSHKHSSVERHTLPPVEHTLHPDVPISHANSKPINMVPNNSDEDSPVTSSPIVLDHNTSPIPSVVTTPDSKEIVQPSTDSPIVVSTPCPDGTTEDVIITLSPIELATDNVSDVYPETTTTTSLGDTLDTATVTYKKQDYTSDDTSSSSEATNVVDKVQQYSTITVSPSSTVSPTDQESDDEITVPIEKYTNDDAQTNSKNLKSNETRKSHQNASYNSLTNTDVPAESDDYAPVTTAPSVQNDTGDTSTTPGGNPLDNNESENDIKITVSTDNDSEDGTITIRIEVSDSTDDAGSSSDDSTLLVSIDTNDDNSKKSKKGGRKNDDDANTGKNVEIDMSNIKGEPTMWIRTTDEDILDKLTSRNTNFDVIYFFPMANQASFERDKKTTIYCNGTVRIDTTETTWAYKNDPNPTVTKTTEFIQIDKSED